MRNKIISFFLQNPEYFLNSVSVHFAFTENELVKYQHVVNWDGISANTQINWTTKLIRKYADRFRWSILTVNPSFFKDPTHVDTFKNLITWKSPDNCVGDGIVFNPGLPWSVEFIQNTAHKIDFTQLSMSEVLPWDEKLIDTFKEYWDWEELGCNESIPWNLELFEKYFDTSYLDIVPIASNQQLTWNIDFIQKYTHHVNWIAVSANAKLPWQEMNLLDKWKDNLQWYGLAQNEKLFQLYPDFFENNLEHWFSDWHNNFSMLSGNEHLGWSKSLILKYQDYWDWEILCQNEGISWNSHLIDTFQNKVVWGKVEPDVLYNNVGEVVSEFGGEYLKRGLVDNPSLPWNLEFIQRYKNSIDLNRLEKNSAVWDKAFKPYVNSDLIKLIFRII